MAELVALALAAWRLAHMLVEEDGPFAMFARLRLRVGLRPAPIQHNGVAMGRVATTPAAELFSCVWCMSVWTAALLALPGLGRLRTLLAASAGAILIQEVVRWVRSR